MFSNWISLDFDLKVCNFKVSFFDDFADVLVNGCWAKDKFEFSLFLLIVLTEEEKKHVDIGWPLVNFVNYKHIDCVQDWFIEQNVCLKKTVSCVYQAVFSFLLLSTDLVACNARTKDTHYSFEDFPARKTSWLRHHYSFVAKANQKRRNHSGLSWACPYFDEYYVVVSNKILKFLKMLSYWQLLSEVNLSKHIQWLEVACYISNDKPLVLHFL